MSPKHVGYNKDGVPYCLNCATDEACSSEPIFDTDEFRFTLYCCICGTEIVKGKENRHGA